MRETKEGGSLMINGFQAQADALGARPAGPFRSKPRLDDEPLGDRVLMQAVERAKEGDREALRYLYLRYADNVYGYVRSIVHDEYEAEDVTQHVFTKLMTALPKYEQRDVPFAGWILRVARNVALDHVRKRRPIPCDEIREPTPLDDEDGAAQTALTLREALATLPEDQRRVIVLRHLVGLTPGEIGEQMGKSEPSVHGLHHRGRGALRTVLAERRCAPMVQRKAAA
jgi:RNA polymerase sigma-70 factor, ECF subfamily